MKPKANASALGRLAGWLAGSLVRSRTNRRKLPDENVRGPYALDTSDPRTRRSMLHALPNSRASTRLNSTGER